MVKKVFAVLAGLLLAIAPAPAFAQDMRIEQVQVNLPQVVAYVYGDADAFAVEQATATLGTQALTLEDIGTDERDTNYYFLVDCSGSIRSAQMQAIQQSLLHFADYMEEANATISCRATLIAFGSGVQVVIDATHDAAALREAVGTLKANQSETLFYDALAKAAELAGNERYGAQRRVAFVFSDSVDENLGGYTKAEVDAMLSSAKLPIYAFGFDTGTKAELDSFGAVARQSGGQIQIVSAATLPDLFGQVLANTQAAQRVYFIAPSNVVEGPLLPFVLSIGGRHIETSVSVAYWQADHELPVVIESAQPTDDTISLRFSENVQGAASVQSYAIVTNKGDLLGIQAAAYEEASFTATLTLSATTYSGPIVITFPGVRDVSMEQNPVDGSVELIFTGKAQPTPPQDKPDADTAARTEEGLPAGAWAILAIVVVVIIIAVVLGVIKKRGGLVVRDGKVHFGGDVTIEQQVADAQQVQVHFVAAQLPVVRLHVTTHDGKSRALELPIDKTLFVGRNEINDVYFDDPQMSRQHFVISEEDGRYTITNLSETDGTRLNGVQIDKPRQLNEGDCIEAGRESIVFYIGKQA